MERIEQVAQLVATPYHPRGTALNEELNLRDRP
jgi:hypothetical protein